MATTKTKLILSLNRDSSPYCDPLIINIHEGDKLVAEVGLLWNHEDDFTVRLNSGMTLLDPPITAPKLLGHVCLALVDAMTPEDDLYSGVFHEGKTITIEI